MPSDRKIRRQFKQQREEIDRNYAPSLSTAAGVNCEQVKHDYERETSECIYGLWSFESQKLLLQADHYNVNRTNPDWYVNPDFTEGDKEILTESAQRELRRLIHIERRARIEWWIKLIAAIIGVLIGLIAILRKN